MTEKVVPINPLNDKEQKTKDFTSDSELLMKKSYERMLMAQGNFSNLAVSRAIEVAKDNELNLQDSHILGVSFSAQHAVVSVLYKPVIILNPEDSGEPKQVNIPVPADCLWPIDDSWKEIYQVKLKENQEAIKNAKESGEMEKALEGDKAETKTETETEVDKEV